MPPKPTIAYKLLADYQEAHKSARKGDVLFGHRIDLRKYYESLKQKREESVFYGCVLYPEGRGESWSEEANKAFWAGAIDAGRNFTFVSDPKRIGTGSYVLDEMLWLQDNNYEFFVEKLPGDPLQVRIQAKAPAVAKEERLIQDYRTISDGERYRLGKTIERKLIAQKKALEAQIKRPEDDGGGVGRPAYGT